MHTADADLLFRLVDVGGVVANAFLAAAIARAKGYDVVGFAMLGVIAGLGGGMVRDVLLGTGFPVALTDPLYLGGALCASALAFLLNLTGTWARRALIVADALALGCWSATGASKALSVGLGWLPAVFLGVITAVGGGMLRDVLINEVPAVFGGNPLYATVAILAGAEMVVLQASGHYALGMALAIATGGTLGVLARWRGWRLPVASAQAPVVPLTRHVHRRLMGRKRHNARSPQRK